MRYTSRSMCSLAAAVLAATVFAGDGDRSATSDLRSERVAKPVSPLVLELAAQAREAELESAKGFGGTSPLVIPAAAFTTNGNHDDTYFFHPFNGAMRGKSSTDGCVQAPVYLPQRAQIFQIYASILDEDSGADVWVSLMRSDNLAYHDADEMASTHTNGSSGTPATSASKRSSSTGMLTVRTMFSHRVRCSARRCASRPRGSGRPPRGTWSSPAARCRCAADAETGTPRPPAPGGAVSPRC